VGVLVVFCRPHVPVAARTINNIRQKGSTAAYYSTFQQVASKLTWDDHALAAVFYNGLNDAVKDKMTDPPEDYKELVDEAIKIDNRLFERRIEKHGGRERPFTGGTNNRFKQRSYGDPTDLDAMEHGKPSRPFNKPRF
jgi:hypothetical protein